MTEEQAKRIRGQLAYIRHIGKRFEQIKGFNKENCMVNGKFDLMAFWKEAISLLSLEGNKELIVELQIIADRASCRSELSAALTQIVTDRITELEGSEVVAGTVRISC